MKFQTFITEDYERVREYKKTVFDLKVAIGELDFYKGEKKPTEADQIPAFNMKGVALKQKIIGLKEKVLKMSSELGESIGKIDGLKDLLDSIPDKDSDVSKKLEVAKSKIGV
jgi:hypothetical protein